MLSDPLFISISLVVSFLGGGIVSAAINWARADRADKKERKSNSLKDQLSGLYGPLYYFCSQSEKCFELNKKFHDAYREEFVNQKWSKNEITRERLDEQTSTTLNIANRYIQELNLNNTKIKEILDNNYSQIDPDDIDIFMLFVEHFLRYKKEIEDQGKLTTPISIYERIGDISFLRPEFIERVKLKFKQKKSALDNLYL
jgi:hypothetical protein